MFTKYEYVDDLGWDLILKARGFAKELEERQERLQCVKNLAPAAFPATGARFFGFHSPTK